MPFAPTRITIGNPRTGRMTVVAQIDHTVNADHHMFECDGLVVGLYVEDPDDIVEAELFETDSYRTLIVFVNGFTAQSTWESKVQ